MSSKRRCHTVACRWHRVHPDVVRIRGHTKWHPFKKSIDKKAVNDSLPLFVIIGMLLPVAALTLPLFLLYLYNTNKNSRLVGSVLQFLHLKKLMVDSHGASDGSGRPYKRVESGEDLVSMASAAAPGKGRHVDKPGLMFTAVCVVGILQGIEIAALAAFFPSAAVKKGVSETMAGVIFAMRPCVQVVLSPVAGRYMQGANQGLILIGGMSILACVYIVFGFLENLNSGFAFSFVCLFAALIQGTVDAAVNTAAFNIILALYKKDVPYRIAIREVYNTVGYLVGTPLGGVLYDTGGFMLPFMVLGVTILASSGGLYVLMPEVHQGGVVEVEKRDPLLDRPLAFYATFLTRRVAVILTAGVVLSGASYPFLETTLTLHAQQLELNESFVGLLFSICNGTFLATMSLIGFGDKLGLSVAAYGLSACSIAFFMVGPTPVIPILPLNTTMLVLSMALAGIGYALAWLPMIHLLIVHLQRAQGQGSAANAAIAGVASAATSMSLVMGSFLGGFLADSFGFCWATTLWALTFLMGFIVSQTENKALYDVH